MPLWLASILTISILGTIVLFAILRARKAQEDALNEHTDAERVRLLALAAKLKAHREARGNILLHNGADTK